MCFNAAKSWYTGWYTEAGKEGHEDLNHFDTPGQWWKGKLVGIDDYLNEIFDEKNGEANDFGRNTIKNNQQDAPKFPYRQSEHR